MHSWIRAIVDSKIILQFNLSLQRHGARFSRVLHTLQTIGQLPELLQDTIN